MSSVKSEWTKLEYRFIEPLLERNICIFDFHASDLPGKPDIVQWDAHIAIFLDSCFWHGCTQHLRMPKTNQEYWKRKIRNNKRRDRYNTEQLEKSGWLVRRIWGHSIKNDRALKWWLTRIESLVRERTT